MAHVRVSRGDQVVEVDGISSAAAYELARSFALQPAPVRERVIGDQELADAREMPFGFAPAEIEAATYGRVSLTAHESSRKIDPKRSNAQRGGGLPDVIPVSDARRARRSSRPAIEERALPHESPRHRPEGDEDRPPSPVPDRGRRGLGAVHGGAGGDASRVASGTNKQRPGDTRTAVTRTYDARPAYPAGCAGQKEHAR